MAKPPQRKLEPVASVEPFGDGRRIIRIGLTVIGIAFGGLGIWAAVAPLSGAVIVPGVLKVESYRKTVQHLEGGIVKEIRVKAGDQVQQGQPLIILESVQDSAVVDILRTQLDGEMAKASRLAAEKNRLPKPAFPQALTERAGNPKVAALMKAESGFFEAKRRLIDGQAGLLRSQILRVKEEIVGLEGQVKSANENIGYINEELKINEDLYKKNFVAYTRLLTIKRALAEKEEKRGEFLALIAQARQKLAELELRIITLYDSYVKEATDELKESEKKIADLEERLRPTQDTLQRRTIAAPIAGEVVDLKVHTVGGTIAPREALMDIVPTNAPLIVEGKARVQDIDEIRVGGQVDVQLSAFKRRTTPKVAGKVSYVSADALTENGAGGPSSYYLVYIEVDKQSLRDLKGVTLSPGMPVEAFVKTQERTMIEYLVQPVTDTLRRSFREP